MPKIPNLLVLLAAVSMLLSACGGQAPSAMMGKPTDNATRDASDTPQAMPDIPDWFGVSLTDVRSGKTFSINDARGKVVLVETMAVWCTNCRIQQNEIKTLHDKLGTQGDLVILSLDIDPNENQGDLKAHTEKYGFDWLYAVAPAEVTREIGNLYTQQFLNPPSTPMLVIDRHGVAHPLPFGIKSVDDLAGAVNMYLSEGM
jgi:cytochrome oxidase Cu insertion factor (SCO1/SenC/PrrC family)